MGGVIVINSGSSSLKSACFLPGDPPVRQEFSLGPGVGFDLLGPLGSGTAEVVKRLGRIDGIGHRIVHGGTRFVEPTLVSPALLGELEKLSPFAPEHLPHQIQAIKICQLRFPDVPQVACFDTAFHKDLPRVSRILPIPRRYEAAGVRRYGFHGLSYAYIVRELGMGAGGRTVIAHLGSGCSLAAVLKGKCIDTTMAFTPSSGIPMSRRSGDLDPGLMDYLAKTEGMTPEQFQKLVGQQSGLLGLSGGLTSDMKELLYRERTDAACAEAVAVFCYSVRKTIGAYAAALGGLDTLVFAGGIGENSDVIRGRICDGLGFLGIELDPEWNAAHKPVISKGSVNVRVIKTDEEVEIARSTWEVLKKGYGSQR